MSSGIQGKINTGIKVDISKLTSGGKYGPPPIPETPSQTINSTLKSRFGNAYDNPVKAGLAFFVCYTFNAINTVYKMIHQDKTRHSHSMWMASCGVISGGVVVVTALLYNIIMASAFFIHSLLYIAAWGFAVFAVALGVSGAVFFDKDATPRLASFDDTKRD